MRFGIFLAPFHPVPQNPTLRLEQDLELIEAMDRLGYDEAWIGEHHSGGYEIIASPEVFIAAAALDGLELFEDQRRTGRHPSTG